MKILIFALLMSLSGCTVYQLPPNANGAVVEPVAAGYGGYGYPLMTFGGYGFGYGGWGSGLGININKTSVNNYSPTITNSNNNVNKAVNPAISHSAAVPRTPMVARSFGGFHR
jgi:hypothetical protein